MQEKIYMVDLFMNECSILKIKTFYFTLKHDEYLMASHKSKFFHLLISQKKYHYYRLLLLADGISLPNLKCKLR